MQPYLVSSRKFCLDTSFVVRLFESFPRNIHVSLWEKIEQTIKGRCHIICEVEAELKSKFDEQYEWCLSQEIPVIEVDEDTFQEARSIIRQYPSWIKPSTTDLYFADPFIVAHARKNDCIVVTAERAEDPAKVKKDVKIPDVCDFYKIQCIAQGSSEIESAPINKFLQSLGIKV